MGAMNCRRCGTPCSEFYSNQYVYLCHACYEEALARRISSIQKLEQFLLEDSRHKDVEADLSKTFMEAIYR